MSIIKPGSGETPKKKPSLGNFSTRLKSAISRRLVDSEEAWDCFSPEAQEEMLKSLDQKDNVDLNSIVKDLVDDNTVLGFGYYGPILSFEEGEIKKDKIGKYIMINGMKCRKRKPGITGFTYNVYYNKYPPKAQLRIGFCNKGTREKSIDKDLMSRGTSRNKNDKEEKPSDIRKSKSGDKVEQKKKNFILGKISERLDAKGKLRREKLEMKRKMENEKAWANFSPEMQEEMLNSLDQKDSIDLNSIVKDLDLDYRDVDILGMPYCGSEEKDKIGKYIMINGMKCRERQPGITGFTYSVYYNKYIPEVQLDIGFCNKGTWEKLIVKELS